MTSRFFHGVQRTISGFISVLVLALFVHSAQAAAPSIISYQGRLSNKTGPAAADGTYTMIFSLFPQVQGGTALWSETNTIRVASGLFVTLLGDQNPLPDEAFGNPAWMEIQIADTVLAPRTQLVAAPYALRARLADGVANGAIRSGMLAPDSVTSDALLDQSITAEKLAPNSIDASRIATGAINFSHLAPNAVTNLVTKTRVAEGSLSVTDYGAVGDGRADDTEAFRRALTTAQAHRFGTKVIVPPGQYRITSTLTVRNALLTGLPAGGWPADTGPMPRLKVDFTNGPCVIAREGASIHGFSFEYDHQGQAARKFGPTILLSGIGISLTNLRLNEAYEGIIADGTSNIGRLNIENIFMVNARQIGVYVTGTSDIATLRNIEVWNYIDHSLANCTAFKFAQNDEIRISNCFAHAARIAYHFVEGRTWGGMVNCSSDFCQWGLQVDDAHLLRIDGGSHWCHWTALTVNGDSTVIVTGADLRSNGNNNVQVLNCQSLTLTGCLLKKNGYSWQNVHMMNLNEGKSVLVSGCTFDDTARGILIQPTMRYFSITGNLFQPSTNTTITAITDNSTAGAMKVIANNLLQR
jgi:hypothetical protein